MIKMPSREGCISQDVPSVPALQALRLHAGKMGWVRPALILAPDNFFDLRSMQPAGNNTSGHKDTERDP